MNERVRALKDKLSPGVYPICTERLRLTTESCRWTEEQPRSFRTALAFAEYLDKMTIFIEDGELIVGNAASK
jgi:hypothetical protein